MTGLSNKTAKDQFTRAARNERTHRTGNGHPPLTLEHQLTGAPREARKASGGQLILVRSSFSIVFSCSTSTASSPVVVGGIGGRSQPYGTPGPGVGKSKNRL